MAEESLTFVTGKLAGSVFCCNSSAQQQGTVTLMMGYPLQLKANEKVAVLIFSFLSFFSFESSPVQLQIQTRSKAKCLKESRKKLDL